MIRDGTLYISVEVIEVTEGCEINFIQHFSNINHNLKNDAKSGLGGTVQPKPPHYFDKSDPNYEKFKNASKTQNWGHTEGNYEYFEDHPVNIPKTTFYLQIVEVCCEGDKNETVKVLKEMTWGYDPDSEDRISRPQDGIDDGIKEQITKNLNETKWRRPNPDNLEYDLSKPLAIEINVTVK